MKKIIRLLVVFFYCFSIGASQEQGEESQGASFNDSEFLGLPVLDDLPYERFIGIGSVCLVRMQINRHLSKRFGKDPRSFGGGQLFDWLIIHNHDKLAEAIENDLSDLFEKSDLTIIPKVYPGFPCVKNRKYQMTWNHLFTRNCDGLLAENIIELEYDIRKQKIDYLSHKFKFLQHYRTLYILAYPFVGTEPLGTVEPTRQMLIRLRDALAEWRGNTNFSILFCPLIKKFEDFENIYIRAIMDESPPIGNDKIWDQILFQFPFTLDKMEIDNSLMDNSLLG